MIGIRKKPDMSYRIEFLRHGMNLTRDQFNIIGEAAELIDYQDALISELRETNRKYELQQKLDIAARLRKSEQIWELREEIRRIRGES